MNLWAYTIPWQNLSPPLQPIVKCLRNNLRSLALSPRLSRRQTYRLHNLGLRLRGLLDLLDILPNRRMPLTAGVAGPALRTIAEARAFANLPPHGLVAKGLPPGQLLVQTLSILDRLTHLKHQNFQASAEFRQKSYPRGSGQA